MADHVSLRGDEQSLGTHQALVVVVAHDLVDVACHGRRPVVEMEDVKEAHSVAVVEDAPCLLVAVVEEVSGRAGPGHEAAVVALVAAYVPWVADLVAEAGVTFVACRVLHELVERNSDPDAWVDLLPP